MSRLLTIAGFIVAAALGAGAVVAYNYLAPHPAPRILSGYQVFPMSAQVTAAACKDGFIRAFRAAGFVNLVPSPPDALHVQAADAGYSATAICMPRREAAALIVTGIDAGTVDTRLNTIAAGVLGRTP